MGLGHESVWVWVWINDCVHVGAINGVMITQNWARVGQQMSQGIIGCNSMLGQQMGQQI